jgi:ribosomal protein S18 acetylase RimI-like enzyme
VNIVIETIEQVDAGLIQAMRTMTPQLSVTAAPVSRDLLEAIVASPTTRLLIARLDEQIVGSLTLVFYELPTGKRARIEDVVVDESVRGRGVASMMTKHAIEMAEEFGARNVELTSQPDRVAANRLYQKLGFSLRTTNVYRFAL